MHKHVSTSILPTEYGGEAGPLSDMASEWQRKLTANREWYLDDQKYGSDEKRRVGRAKNADMLFGIDGSFRSLEID